MKLKHLLLTALLAVVSPVLAHADEAPDTAVITYCDGNWATVGQSAYSYRGSGWTEAAIRIPASKVEVFVGNELSQVRYALSSRSNVDTLVVWVRSALTGENLTSRTIVAGGEPNITRGWTTLDLDAPYPITPGMGELYVGYSIHQKGSVAAISLVKPAVANSSYVKLGPSASWTDTNAGGALSVEAVVVGNNIPDVDLAVTNALMYEDTEQPNTIIVEGTVTNFGARAAAGFTLKAYPEGSDVAVAEQHFDDNVNADHSVDFKLSVPSTEKLTPSSVFNIEVIAPEGNTDNVPGNNTRPAGYTWSRNVLLEEFTTEQCPNCPRVAGFVHDVLGQEPYKTKVVAVCHHSAYYTDQYTQQCDQDYRWFFNEGGTTYAPSLMVDREAYFDAQYVSGALSATFLPGSAAQLKNVLDAQFQVRATAKLDIHSRFNADSSQVIVTVVGQRSPAFNVAYPRLNVQITEDNIPTTGQSGASGTFIHQHVTRAYNNTWGDVPEWVGNTFTKSYVFDLNPAWKKQDLKAIAWLYNYNQSDKTDCAVENSASVNLVRNRADISGDGQVNNEDVTTLVSAVVSDNATIDADVNGDGVVDSTDITEIIKNVVGAAE